MALNRKQWKITLPKTWGYFHGGVGSGDKGRAHEVKNPSFASFSHPEFFYFDHAEGGQVFRAPVVGYGRGISPLQASSSDRLRQTCPDRPV